MLTVPAFVSDDKMLSVTVSVVGRGSDGMVFFFLPLAVLRFGLYAEGWRARQNTDGK